MIAPEKEAQEAASEAKAYYFASLTVEGVRCFKTRQTLNLSTAEGLPAPWTIIIGDNGVGKTTLLQCLAYMQLKFDEIPNWPVTKFLRGFQEPFSHLAPQYPFGNKIHVNAGLGLSVGIQHKMIELTEVSLFSEIAADPTGQTSCDLLCFSYGASRSVGNASLNHDPYDLASAYGFTDTTELINSEEWLLQADYARARGASGAADRQESVHEMLIGLLPDVSAIRFQEGTGLATPKPEFQTPYGWVTFDNLSLGYRSAITWMIDLAARLYARYPDSPNPLNEPAIVLIDEIDLHLHPKWQRELISKVTETFPNTQFIATAHSPLILQSAKDANIALLRREGDHVVIDNNPESIKGWRVDQILTSDLFGLPSARPPELDSLLEERDAILSMPFISDENLNRLTKVENQIGELPSGEFSADLKAMDIIRRAAKILRPTVDNYVDSNP